jgi:hypothetical protein
MKKYLFLLLMPFFGPWAAAQDWQLATPRYETADAFVIGHTVHDFGAKGDGVSDDTKAIQDALDALRFGRKHDDPLYNAGGVVFLPEGRYVIRKTLTIPRGVTLRGEWEKPVKGQPIRGTVLVSYVGKYAVSLPPTLMLESCSAAMDLAIWYPEQDPAKITAFSPAVCLGSSVDGWEGQAMCAKNITLVNAYDGVVFQRKYKEGGASPAVYNIYGTPLHTGIEVDCLSDVGRVEHVDFSPDYWSGSGLPGSPEKGGAFEDYIYQNGTGILMMRNDWSYTCFIEVEGYARGFHSSRSANTGVRGPNGHNYGMTFRRCQNGVYFSGIANSGIMFSRINIEKCERGFAVGELPDHSSINLLHINNCTIDATEYAILSEAESQAYITVFQSHILGGAVDIRSGSFLSTDAEYTNPFPHLRIGSEARMLLSGNRFTDASQIVNHSLFACVDDPTPVAYPPMPEVKIANPDSYRQKPERAALYVATAAPFHAAGDGTADNTAALQAALNQAAADGGGIVYLPPGKYKVTGHLTIPTGVELKGATDFRTCPGTPGATLCVYADRNNPDGRPFLQLEERSGVRGVVFNYPEQVTTDMPHPATYPYTIQGLGDDIYLVNIGFIAAYRGIDLFSHKCDNFYVDGVGGHTFKVGVRAGGHSDGGILANVQFNVIYFAVGYQYKFGSWPNAVDDAAAKQACYDYALDELDFLVVDDCSDLVLYNNFGYGSQRGAVFTSSGGGGASGVALGLAADGARRGFCFEAVSEAGFGLINSQIVALRANTSDTTSCYIETTPSLGQSGPVSLYSCNYWGATHRAMRLKGGSLHLYASNFVNTGENGFAQVAGEATGLDMAASVVRVRDPLLLGRLAGVRVQASVADVRGFSTENVALWRNNLSFHPALNGSSLPDRTGWVATASVNDFEAPNTLDGNLASRWTTGRQLENSGATFSVDMQAPWTFNKIILEHTPSANDFPEKYEVFVSNDGSDWGAPIRSAPGMAGGTMIIGFAAQTAQHVRVALTAQEKTQHWSIHEFYALFDPEGPASALPPLSREADFSTIWAEGGVLYWDEGLFGAQVAVYDVAGRMVVPSQVARHGAGLSLPRGLYIVTIQTGGRRYTAKIRI